MESGMYDQLSHDYDRFVNWPGRLAYEMPFLLQQIKRVTPHGGRPLRVLDAACGTGQHAIALVKSGMQVSGADLSTNMIGFARENAAKAGVSADFNAAGFGKLSAAFGKESFDALLCLGNSLPHLLTLNDLASAVTDFFKCLVPGGILILQNRNFDGVLANRNRWMEPQSHIEGDHEWLFQRFYDFEPDGLIRFNIVTLKRQSRGDWHPTITSTQLYPQTRQELESALHNAGLADIHAYGSLEDIEFDAQKSSNLVVVARKQ